jgi:enoyl-CoA hydratase/carnithine racemase
MASPVVLLDRPAPHVARVRINRPDKRNAIDHEVRELMTQHLQALLADGETRALVFGGVDGVFSAGGDVPSMAGLSPEQARQRMQHIHVLCRLVAQARIPVVSAMEGIAAGAVVGLALLGDHIVAGPGTRVLFPFLKLGLAPDWGQLLTLPRRVGLGTARRILTSGQAVAGEEAHRIGLADALVPDAEVMATAVRAAGELALLPQQAFGRMKMRLNHPSATLDDELAREEDDQSVCLAGPDFQEGYDAFRNKRAADFIARPGASKP